jgi:hypothetical protein
MKLNENLPFILRDVYVYDIEACHYNILKQKGFDVSNINSQDKIKRNILIGKLMRDNPRITSLLRTTTESIINDYINTNNIKSDDIIIRQYDGLILAKKIHTTNIGHIPLECREIFTIFISSITRTSYIALDSKSDIKIKGVPFRYKAIDDVYKKICNVLDVNKNSMFIRLQKIKDDFYNSQDSELFGIPDKNGNYNIFLKGYGELKVSRSTLKIMDTDDIDRSRYFKFYIEPFTKSIVYENVR